LKLEVVRMIKEQGLSIMNVSQSMDIGVTAIRRWLKQCEDEQKGGGGRITSGSIGFTASWN
jgi:transposase